MIITQASSNVIPFSQDKIMIQDKSGSMVQYTARVNLHHLTIFQSKITSIFLQMGDLHEKPSQKTFTYIIVCGILA